MFGGLQMRMRYGMYLRNDNGIKKFAEMCVDQLVSRVTKKSAFYREMNENMLVEKANLRMRAEELREKPMLDAGEFFSARRRVWGNSFLVGVVIVASIFLTFVSISAFAKNEAGATGFVRWFVSGILALVLTGGGLIIAERLIEGLIPRDNHRTAQLREASRSVAPLWAVLLVGIELALLGLAEVRARTLADPANSSLLYFGFIALVMLLPLVAGAFRWDSMQFLDVYKTTLALRQIESRLAQIDSVLRQNEEYESNFYKIRSIEYWDLLNNFRTHKDNYNARHGVEENLNGHFSLSYDSFQAEANKRYASDIRDITAASIRKLELVPGAQSAGATGTKIGQALHSLVNADGGIEEHDPVYLGPQPIR